MFGKHGGLVTDVGVVFCVPCNITVGVDRQKDAIRTKTKRRFFDEVADMPQTTQAKILRILTDQTFERVGGDLRVQVNVRVVSATSRNLRQEIDAGRFREDLYHRLNVVPVQVPSLTQRREDIPLLIKQMMVGFTSATGRPSMDIDEESLSALQAHDWPGNVRQLVNACRRLTVIAPGRDIRLEDLPEELGGVAQPGAGTHWTDGLADWVKQALARGETDLLASAGPAFGTGMIEQALAAADGKRQEAARLLGWGRNTLSRKIRELGLDETGDA